MTWVIAHRCNSLQAVERAIALGADMIELDVRRTRDGDLIAFHDRAHERAGAPLLAEVLALARGRVPLDVELKEDGYVDEVARLLGTGLDTDALIVTSFLDAVLAQVRRHLPEVRTGLLLGSRRPRPSQLFPAERARRCGADYVAPELRLARLGALRRAHAAGFPALVWTVNRDDDLAALLRDERVAGVITDVPERALALRDA